MIAYCGNEGFNEKAYSLRSKTRLLDVYDMAQTISEKMLQGA